VEIRVSYADDTNRRLSSGPGAKGDYLEFSVSDTGVGIGPEDKERIFDEFEQVDSTLSRNGAALVWGLP